MTEQRTGSGVPDASPLRTAVPAEGGLELAPAEAEVLAEEVEAFAATLKDPDARRRYAQLGHVARQGVIPPELVPSLQAMLELVLQTQRVRRQYGPEAEKALAALFYRTPRGSVLRQAAREVNDALAVLRGQTIEQLSIAAAPGRHKLVVETNRCRLTLELGSAGARVEHLEVAR